MTKLAILSDIHGNLPALEAVLQDLSQFKMDHAAPMRRSAWRCSTNFLASTGGTTPRWCIT